MQVLLYNQITCKYFLHMMTNGLFLTNYNQSFSKWGGGLWIIIYLSGVFKNPLYKFYINVNIQGGRGEKSDYLTGSKHN